MIPTIAQQIQATTPKPRSPGTKPPAAIPTIVEQIEAIALTARSPATSARSVRIEKTIELICANGPITAKILQKHLAITRHLAHDYLRAIEHEGLISRYRSGNATYFKLAERTTTRRKAA